MSHEFLQAKPRRLEENVEGALYVNDRCINCAACSNFAPRSFAREESRDAFHYVYQQPKTEEEMEQARAALAACPVAAIRLETKAERQHRAQPGEAVSWTGADEKVVQGLRIGGSDKAPPFPRPFLGDMRDVYFMGHHNERSFGATPYMLKAQYQGKTVWIMVDTPRFSASSQRAVESLTNGRAPDYLFLTHVDDTADHQKWVDHYEGRLQRIFHAGDLGRHNWLGDKTLEKVEILLQPASSSNDSLVAYSLDGEVLSEDWQETYPEELVILHTPGHSPGSITLYHRPSDKSPGVLFTGDTYAFTTRHGGRMSGFGRYGNNLRKQAETLQHLVDLDWQVIAPGHGHPRDYRSIASDEERSATQKAELQVAIEDLVVRRF